MFRFLIAAALVAAPALAQNADAGAGITMHAGVTDCSTATNTFTTAGAECRTTASGSVIWDCMSDAADASFAAVFFSSSDCSGTFSGIYAGTAGECLAVDSNSFLVDCTTSTPPPPTGSSAGFAGSSDSDSDFGASSSGAGCSGTTVQTYLRDDAAYRESNPAESGCVESERDRYNSLIRPYTNPLAFGQHRNGRGWSVVLSFDVPEGTIEGDLTLRLAEQLVLGANPYEWCTTDSGCLTVQTSDETGFRGDPKLQKNDVKVDAKTGATVLSEDALAGAITRNAAGWWSIPIKADAVTPGALTQIRLRYNGNSPKTDIERMVDPQRVRFYREGADQPYLEACLA